MEHRRRGSRGIGLWAAIVALAAPPAGGQAGGLEITDTVTRHGITWKFETKVRVGRFVNGDAYVVGPATVAGIDPKPEDGRNGSVLNLPVDPGVSGFDHRVSAGRYGGGEKLRVLPPIALKPGDALLSSISVDPGSRPSPLRPSDKNLSPVGSVSVLTCLAKDVPADAFRPGYCDRTQRIYRARDVRRNLLPRLPRAGIDFRLENGATFTIDDFARSYERPWLEVCFFHFDAAAEYQVQYGREAGRAAGISVLLLSLDFRPEEKERLLVNFVQYGIDLGGIVRAGSKGWPAHGGHGSGRKLPLVFAGMMLGDEELQRPARDHPDLRFGEDLQTMYGPAWTGAKVVYAGHVGQDGKGEWGAYEHLPPEQWPGDLGESYRRCCTSVAWVGQALALRILHAEKVWDHDAFFDYVDRWMTEDDTEHVARIKHARGSDYSASWARQRQAWDPFVDQMWARYRTNLPPAK